MPDEKRRAAALGTWKVYRRWAAASATMKRRVDLLKRVVLVLAIAALVLGPLTTAEPPFGPEWLVRAVSIASGLCVALGAYLSDKVLGQDRDVRWVRARQAAEGLKSVVFAFLAGAPPFDVKNAVDALNDERERIEKADILASLVAPPIDTSEAEKGFPPSDLSAEEYVRTRAREQQSWFEQKSLEYHSRAANLETAAKALGGVAVVLGMVVAYWPRLGVWVGVATSVAASLAAQVTGGHSRFLQKSYSDAAARLARIITRWETSDRTPADAKRLAGDCEQALREENAGWVAEMLKKQVAASDGRGPAGRQAAAAVEPAVRPS